MLRVDAINHLYYIIDIFSSLEVPEVHFSTASTSGMFCSINILWDFTFWNICRFMCFLNWNLRNIYRIFYWFSTWTQFIFSLRKEMFSYVDIKLGPKWNFLNTTKYYFNIIIYFHFPFGEVFGRKFFKWIFGYGNLGILTIKSVWKS